MFLKTPPITMAMEIAVMVVIHHHQADQLVPEVEAQNLELENQVVRRNHHQVVQRNLQLQDQRLNPLAAAGNLPLKKHLQEARNLQQVSLQDLSARKQQQRN